MPNEPLVTVSQTDLARYMEANDDFREQACSALQGLIDACEGHLPKIDGKFYTAKEGGYFIERELRIARSILRDFGPLEGPVPTDQ